jgi:hypothetical protein
LGVGFEVACMVDAVNAVDRLDVDDQFIGLCSRGLVVVGRRGIGPGIEAHVLLEGTPIMRTSMTFVVVRAADFLYR